VSPLNSDSKKQELFSQPGIESGLGLEGNSSQIRDHNANGHLQEIARLKEEIIKLKAQLTESRHQADFNNNNNNDNDINSIVFNMQVIDDFVCQVV